MPASGNSGAVIRDGFTDEHCRFFAKGRVELVDGAELEAAFLPRLTAKANELLRDNCNFVRGQLQHYGVAYDEKKFSGNGTVLLKKALECGQVRFSRHRELSHIPQPLTFHQLVSKSARPHPSAEIPDAHRVAAKPVPGEAFRRTRPHPGKILC